MAIKAEKIHQLPHTQANAWHTLLLFVPIFIFFLTLAFLTSHQPKKQYAWESQNSTVLGVENEIK